MSLGEVYLIPNVLYNDDAAYDTMPIYVLNAAQKCQAFFVENEKVARRYLKHLSKDFVVDNYKWFPIHKAEDSVKNIFLNELRKGSNIGIISDAGCPGIADPGQILIDAAQQIGATIHPLVGPSSILLALMASGMNGQRFQFNGYLPIDNIERRNTIKQLEEEAAKKNCTQIFIETPYRNNALFKDILAVCKLHTKLCIAANITSSGEKIQTKTIGEWKKGLLDLNKQPAIFLIAV